MAAQPVQDLRTLLEQRFPDALPVRYGTVEGVATGVEALDAILPSGGLPRGRVTAWSPGGGATALLHAACRAVVARGERAAWVDGSGTVAGVSWRGGPALFRPADALKALECTEVLLRSGGFALVVLSGGQPGETEWVRLSRAAKEGGGALVVVPTAASAEVEAHPARNGSGARGRGGGRAAGGKGAARAAAGATRTSAAAATRALQVTSRTPAEGFHWREGPFGPAQVEAVTVQLRVEAQGLQRRAQVVLPLTHHEHRLSLEPGLADRRGAPRPR